MKLFRTEASPVAADNYSISFSFFLITNGAAAVRPASAVTGILALPRVRFLFSFTESFDKQRWVFDFSIRQ